MIYLLIITLTVNVGNGLGSDVVISELVGKEACQHAAETWERDGAPDWDGSFTFIHKSAVCVPKGTTNE